MTGCGGEDDDRSVRRRDLIKTVGAGALATSLAGCSVLSDAEPAARDDTTDTTAPSTDDETQTTSDAETEADTEEDPDEDASGTDGSTAGVAPCTVDGAGGDAAVEIGGGIASDTTLGAESNEYLVTRSLSVNGGATLTIEPGTRLRFSQNTGLEVEADSALSAVGRCDAPIVFTGDQATRGYWDGIHFDEADQTASELSYCVVEYGGGDAYSWSAATANVAVSRGARVRVDHSTIRESAAYGFAFTDDVTVDSFGENTVTANAEGAGYVSARTAHFLGDSGTYVGNDEDRVHVHGTHVGSDFEGTWDALDAPYLVRTGTGVEVNGELTIAPGATIEFGQDAWFRVNGDGPGTLTAVGVDPNTEESKPITFTGEQKTRGYWGGIAIDESDRTPSRFQNVVVEYGGGGDFSWAPAYANLLAYRGSRVSVVNCTLRESDAYGFAFSGDATVDAFTQNTVTRNDEGAGRVAASTAHALSDTSTYTGNDSDFVSVHGNHIGADYEESWDAIDVPYRVETSRGVEVNGHVTIDPGATIEFEQDAWFRVNGDGPGRLTAVGIDPNTEESKPITFTGVQKTRGYWAGIAFDETNRTENQLRNCVVEYGGGGDFSWAPASANVAAYRGSRVRIDGSTIRESGAYGFAFSGDATVDSFATNTVTQNETAAGRVAASTAHALSDTGTYAGNDHDHVLVHGNSITSGDAVTWDAIDVPYRVETGRGVEISGHLTIDPGTTVEFGQGSWMRARDGGPGALTAVGTSDDPITFTGEQKTAGYWYGLAFDETGRTENKLHYCVVEYGGSDEYSWAPEAGNVAVFRGSTLSLENSTVRDGAGYGIVVSDDSSVAMSGNALTGNSLGPQV